MRRFLSRLFSSIATLLISSLIIAWIINVTLLSSAYLVSSADHSGLFRELSAQLPTLIFPGKTADSLRLQAELSRQLSPAIVRSESQTFLGSLESYVREGGSLPTAPFAKTINSLDSDRLPDAAADHPVDNPTLISIHRWYMVVHEWFIRLVLIALAAALLVLALQSKRLLSTIIRMAFTILLSLVISYVSFKALPSLVADRMQLGPDLAPTLPVLKAWLTQVVAGMNSLVVKSGIIVLAVAAALAVLSFAMQHSKRGGEIKGLDDKASRASDF